MSGFVKRERVAALEALGRAKYAPKPDETLAPELVEMERLAATVAKLAESLAQAGVEQSKAIQALLKQQAEIIDALRAALTRREEWTFTWVDRDGQKREMKARQEK